MLGLDTHVLARNCVREGGPARAQEEAARTPVEGGRPLFVSKTVVLELEWVLRGVYGHPAADVCRVFEHRLALEHVEVDDRANVQAALGNLKRGQDLADALHHASSRACEAFVTFDAKGFAGKAKRLALTPPVQRLA
jgi:predicted nucleic-acid-binding protein